MPISLKQKQILAFPYTTKYQALICDGAVRSGKTSLMTVAFVDWAMREFNNTNFAICGKTVGSAIKNIIVPYMALTYAQQKYGIHFTRSDNKMVVRRGSVTNTFYVYGGKDESSYMLIQGITLAGVLLDEVALMSRSFVEQALARCLSFKNRRYFFNCNPDSPAHWFYNEWVLQPEKHRALHLHFLMSDNPILDAETIKEAENTWSGVFYDRYVLGEWVKAEGLVYPFFDVKTNVYPNEKYKKEPFSALNYISVDYGTLNPFSAGKWRICNGIAYRMKEFYHSGRDSGKQMTDEEYADAVEKLMGDDVIQYTVVDPSAASFIQCMRRRGHSIRQANNDVMDGIRYTSRHLKNGRIQIHESCKDAIREFGLYAFDPDNSTDAVIKENDHAMDDIRYFALTVLSREWAHLN